MEFYLDIDKSPNTQQLIDRFDHVMYSGAQLQVCCSPADDDPAKFKLPAANAEEGVITCHILVSSPRSDEGEYTVARN